MSASAGDPVEGDEIGPYRVVRRLGGGGMGVVVEASDPSLGRRVALKVISAHFAQDEEFRRRFTAEARALASLDSPHVVQVHAYGEHRGRLYIATQLIPDGDLARLLRTEGPLRARVGLDLVGQVAAGLADAHAAGLVHRDIKPANVLLRRGGGPWTAYLCDFGVATRVGVTREPLGTIGTPAWMAPELHAGGPAGVASDVYSLGCVLWATLTGRPPYTGETDDQVASAHREQPVPQLAGDSPLVDAVNRVLRRAMDKEPSARYRAAALLREDLRRAAHLSEAPPRRTTRRPAPIVLASTLVLVAAAGPSAGPTGEPPPGPRRSSAVAEAKAEAGLARALAARDVLSPAEARCTARRWIEGAGLRSMVAAGYFDAHLGFVDRPARAMTPRIESAATAAARACAHS